MLAPNEISAVAVLVAVPIGLWVLWYLLDSIVQGSIRPLRSIADACESGGRGVLRFARTALLGLFALSILAIIIRTGSILPTEIVAALRQGGLHMIVSPYEGLQWLYNHSLGPVLSLWYTESENGLGNDPSELAWTFAGTAETLVGHFAKLLIR